MMDMFKKMLPPLKNNVHIVLLGQAAQSGNLPSLVDYVGPHPQNDILGCSCQNVTSSKILFFYPLIGDILGLDDNASLIHVNKAIDATLLLSSSAGTIYNQEICDSQKAALATVKSILDKPVLNLIFPIPKKKERE
jgi:hypothetical protein